MNRRNLRVFLLGLGVAAVGAGLSDVLARMTVRAESRTDAKGADRCAR
jgi:hypothetical protein